VFAHAILVLAPLTQMITYPHIVLHNLACKNVDDIPENSRLHSQIRL